MSNLNNFVFMLIVCVFTVTLNAYTERGSASWYGNPFHGRKTASGEVYNMYSMTAAHKTLPFNTVVVVKRIDNGASVKVRINDRGPFVQGRIIDLSYEAGRQLGIIGSGHAMVTITTDTTAPVSSKKWIIVAGTYSKKTNAESAARQIKQGKETLSLHFDGTYYRILVGSFSSKESAEQRMNALGIRGYVVDGTRFGR